MTSKRIAPAERRAFGLGVEHGTNAGSWVFDGNTSDETIRRVLQGYEDGDPEIMEMCPNPLSGEWAGDPTPADILREVGLDPGDDTARDVEMDNIEDDVLTAYEMAFQDGFWDEVIRTANARIS